MSRTINPAGMALIKQFEGLYLHAYKCPAGVPTIGYGHTKDVSMNMEIDKAHADQLLRDDLSPLYPAIDRLVTRQLTDDQFSALCSFCFNVGLGNFRASTLLKRLNAGRDDDAAYEFSRWVKATVNGRKCTLAGLVKRRAAEAALFLGQTDDEKMPQQVEDERPSARRYRVIARSGLNLRGGPGSGHGVVDVLRHGCEVTEVKSRGDWLQVDVQGDGSIDGWVHRDYLRPLAAGEEA